MAEVGEIAVGLSGEGNVATEKFQGKPMGFPGQRHADTRPGAWESHERTKDIFEPKCFIQARSGFEGMRGTLEE